MKQITPIVSACLLLAGCQKNESKSADKPSSERDVAHAAESNAADGQAEADACVDAIKARVDSGLPSHFRIGQAKVSFEAAAGSSRRGVMFLPVIANEDLYRPTGQQAGEHQLLERVKKKDDSETIRFRLIGSKARDRWFWRDEIEEDVKLYREVKPISGYKNGVIKDSTEHLTLIQGDSDRRDKEAQEDAALDAKARQEKLPPLAEILKPGAKAIGKIGNSYIHLVVTEADPSGTSWTMSGNTMSKDGKTHYTDKGSITVAYDPKKHEVIVGEATLGALVGIRGAIATVTDGTLEFQKGRVETTQTFKFE